MPIHQACRARLTGYVHSAEYQDIICGAKIESSARVLGSLDPLIHVSEGANLIFLELLLQQLSQRITRRSRMGPLILAPILLLFTTAHGCSPSTVRVTVSILLRSLIRHWQLRWTECERLTTAGLAALLFCRSLQQIPGLLVGWVGSLALQIGRRKNPQSSGQLATQIRLYLLLLPALMPFAVPHPLSILCYCLFYPSVGFGLFVCALLVFLFPPLGSATDALFDFLWRVFAQFASLLPPPWQGQTVPLSLLLLYLFALTAWSRNQEAPTPIREPVA